MPRAKAFCSFMFCPETEKIIWDNQRAAYAVTGYEREREGGGPNQIWEKNRTGLAYHDRHDSDCYTRHVRGYDQPTLE